MISSDGDTEFYIYSRNRVIFLQISLQYFIKIWLPLLAYRIPIIVNCNRQCFKLKADSSVKVNQLLFMIIHGIDN